MRGLHPVVTVIAVAVIALLTASPATAKWSADPGATVRNIFGPNTGTTGNQCRGACGAGCPKTCSNEVTYECANSSQLRRVQTYECGTNLGCRVHDDCLDTCVETNDGSGTCASQCDANVVEKYGLASSASWMTGGGPYDGKIRFEYTRNTPRALEPAYRCPTGSTRQCSGGGGCQDASGARVEPVFDSYSGAPASAMRVSELRAGPVRGDAVYEQSNKIRVTGADTCPGGSCTRYGIEFDYRNADPSAPLLCAPSTTGGESDFVGDLLKQGADASGSRGIGTSGGEDDGMAQLMGMFGKVLASGESPEDVDVSMAPLGADGKPIESQRVGSAPKSGPPPIPRSITLASASGHLLLPMYELAGASNAGQTKQRHIRCTHKGAPVLETVFVLQSKGNAKSGPLNKNQAGMQQSAEQMKQSMQKTDAEKKSFKNEADAMEDELGF